MSAKYLEGYLWMVTWLDGRIWTEIKVYFALSWLCFELVIFGYAQTFFRLMSFWRLPCYVKKCNLDFDHRNRAKQFFFFKIYKIIPYRIPDLNFSNSRKFDENSFLAFISDTGP